MGQTATQEQIVAKVINVISKTTGIGEDEVTLTAMLADDLGMDSLDAVEVIMNLEKEFNISIDDSDADMFSSVQNIVTFLLKKGVTV